MIRIGVTWTPSLAALCVVVSTQLFLSLPLHAQDVRPPQKIITPNGDGINDTLDFPNTTSNTTIDIYDERGRSVRHMKGAPSWDGRDEGGNVVGSGVYIYQVKDGGGQTVSGIVGVAK